MGTSLDCLASDSTLRNLIPKITDKTKPLSEERPLFMYYIQKSPVLSRIFMAFSKKWKLA